MSVPEIAPAAESTPAAEQSAVKQAAMNVPDTENTAASPHPEEATKTIVGDEATSVPGKESTEEPAKGEAIVEATPAAEGVLGYKAPGIIHFRFVKHFFWLNEEPMKAEDLAHYIRSEKNDYGHPNAAWAQETGKGLLFFSKRAEDKATPSGIISLADVTDVTKEGSEAFSFKTHHHTHKFEAANAEERDAWIVAIEKMSGEAKGMKEGLTGSESYKKTMDGYAKSPAVVGAGAAAAGAAAMHKKETSTSRPPKKSLDATTATSTPAADGLAKETDGTTEEEPKKDVATTKSRSQSRKRLSVFGTILGKKEEKKEEKEETKELTEEEKAEKEAALKKEQEEQLLAAEKAKEEKAAADKKVREEKLAAAEKAKQERAEHERKKEAEAKEKADKKAAEKKAKEEQKAVEEKAKQDRKAKAAAEKQEAEKLKAEKKAEAKAREEEAKKERDAQKAKDAAEAAAVAAVPAAAVAAEKKHEDKKEEKAEEKAEATTPTDKKGKRTSVFGGLFGKKDATSPTAEKTETEAAPAVPAKDSDVLPVSETAPKIEEPIENQPMDTAAVVAAADTVQTPAAEETSKELSATPADATTPKTAEKSGLLGFIKKTESRLTGKKEDKKEDQAAETIAKDPVVAAAPTETAATESTPKTATEERPAREKRRTSLFGSLGTLKKKPTSTETGSEDTAGEVKREKSPLPQKLGGLFRKPSKAMKPAETAEETKPEAPVTNGETAETSGTTPETTESKIVGDVVPEDMHSTVHDAVTSEAAEPKTTTA